VHYPTGHSLAAHTATVAVQGPACFTNSAAPIADSALRAVGEFAAAERHRTAGSGALSFVVFPSSALPTAASPTARAAGRSHRVSTKRGGHWIARAGRTQGQAAAVAGAMASAPPLALTFPSAIRHLPGGRG
jgi:hypothetical protein